MADICRGYPHAPADAHNAGATAQGGVSGRRTTTNTSSAMMRICSVYGATSSRTRPGGVAEIVIALVPLCAVEIEVDDDRCGDGDDVGRAANAGAVGDGCAGTVVALLTRVSTLA